MERDSRSMAADAKKEVDDFAMKVNAKMREDDAMKDEKKMEDDAMNERTIPMPRRPLQPGEPGFRHGTLSMPSSEFEAAPDSEYKTKAAAERSRKKEIDDFAMKVNAKMEDDAMKDAKKEDDTMKDAKKEDDTMKDAKKTDAKMEDDAMMED